MLNREESGTHMILGQLHQSANTGDIDHTRSISFNIRASFCQESQECRGDVVDGESVDLVEVCPAIWAVVVEEGIAKCFWVFVLRG